MTKAHTIALKQADANFDSHNAIGNANGGYKTAKGGAHKNAARAWGLVRSAVNMNKPLDEQQEYSAALANAVQLGLAANAL